MGYNILRFEHNKSIQWGVLKDDTIAPFATGVEALSEIMNNHLETASQLAKGNTSNTVALSAVKVISPVTRPTRLLCLGMNYYEHREETQHDQKTKQICFFRKDESAITGPTDDIEWPEDCTLLDYEVEMGLVIKKDLTKPTTITKENIGDYVGGVVLVNDVSPRDLMIFAPFGQWYMGKSNRTMCPIGPYVHIFEEGEAKKVHDMEIKLWVNDELKQEAHAKDLIAKPEEALTKASGWVDLEVGNVVLMGTPGGVAIRVPDKKEQAEHFKMSPEKQRQVFTEGQLEGGRYLKDGDVIRCSLNSSDGSINGGELRNTVVKK